MKNQYSSLGNDENRINTIAVVLSGYNIAALSNSIILKNSSELPDYAIRGYLDLQPEMIRIDEALFIISATYSDVVEVHVAQIGIDLQIRCSCGKGDGKLCKHAARVLYNLQDRRDLRAFFDRKTRDERLEIVAKDYGLDQEADLDKHFDLEYTNRSLQIKPKDKDLILVNQETVAKMGQQLGIEVTKVSSTVVTENVNRIVVIGQHKYYDHFQLSIYDSATTREGKVKNPLHALNPLDLLWKTDDADSVRFLSAIAKFNNYHREKNNETDIEALRAVVSNPAQYPFYYHNIAISENVSASSIVPVVISKSVMDIHINVDEKDVFYEISGRLILNDKALDLASVVTKYEYFVFLQETLYLIDHIDALRVISFFKQYHQKIVIHRSKFEAFRLNVLDKLENKIRLTYSFLKPATAVQREENGYNTAPSKLIYLEDFGNHVMLTPVMKYGQTEVPIFSKKQIYALDAHGNPFTVLRDEDSEVHFTASLIRQHPDFKEQLGKSFMSLPKTELLNENWFLEAFSTWTDEGISILGFNSITKKNINIHKAQVTVHVSSGINWFDTTAQVHFGKQKVTLKNLHKAVKNRSKYVTLDDGSTGILPLEWLDKFSSYFETGEVVGEVIRTPKSNFTKIREMYEAEALTQDVKEEIAFFESRFANFETIGSVSIPLGLNTNLRDYQKEGLNWLNFLDDFGFGGCLADDMGLGKTIQIIAFILSQREKQPHNTNLIIVPTSLIFNWEAEIAKFAPSLKMLTVYGAGRVKEINDFNRYEVILTSYGTMLSDINMLKKFVFNYIFLDESQAIKNPDSQRYKAARLLQARNRIALTGTPIENNTFDIYGQLSFACPGLLGSKTQFRNYFSTPIDRFQDYEKARELQRRINPFILRRTKKQVASELPDKTEMILYCEMGEEQRRVYNAYELEFYTYLNTTREVDIPRESLHVLQGLTKLRQICDSPALLNDDLYYGNSSAKIEVLMEQIESKSPQHKILVFSQFVNMLDLIRNELVGKNIAFEYLTGQTKDREARVENFQTNENVRVFLISLKAGGTGLNLTQADYVYLVDPWWNPAVENQAIDRSYRIGQKKNVIAVRLICPGTIEEKIMELQESKRDLADDLVKTDVSVLKSLSKKDLLGLLGK